MRVTLWSLSLLYNKRNLRAVRPPASGTRVALKNNYVAFRRLGKLAREPFFSTFRPRVHSFVRSFSLARLFVRVHLGEAFLLFLPRLQS